VQGKPAMWATADRAADDAAAARRQGLGPGARSDIDDERHHRRLPAQQRVQGGNGIRLAARRDPDEAGAADGARQTRHRVHARARSGTAGWSAGPRTTNPTAAPGARRAPVECAHRRRRHDRGRLHHDQTRRGASPGNLAVIAPDGTRCRCRCPASSTRRPRW
jgi:hypothetical protein